MMPTSLLFVVPVGVGAHFTPSVWVESAVSICPSAPTGRRVVVVPWTIRSPLVVVGSENPPPPPDGVCQVAADEDVAVGTWPTLGVPDTVTPLILVPTVST